MHGRGSQDGTGQRWAGNQLHLLGLLLPRISVGKEEVLCRLQEENQRLSREQERVSRVDRAGDRLSVSRVRAELQDTAAGHTVA